MFASQGAEAVCHILRNGPRTRAPEELGAGEVLINA
jgi:hypothetical protein